jgi:glycosyltransferase involved in cell wall biosynthesis
MDGATGRLSIAYVHYGAQSGVTSAVSHALCRRGHAVRLVSATGDLEPRDPTTRRLRTRPAVFLHLAIAAARFGRRALAHRWNTPFAFDRHARRAGAALADLDPEPDVVLQNGALFSPGLPPRLPYALLLDYTGALAARRPSVSLPSPLELGPAWRLREGSLYRGASVIATFSENTAKSLVQDYGVDPARVRVVGAGANVSPCAAPRRHDGATILFVGRDWQRKGGPVLAEAFERLRRFHTRARLVVAGPASRPNLPERGLYLGPIGLEELTGLLAQATAFALPALREPFGLAFLDAMARGVPCVGTRVDAIPEIVVDRRTGLLVPPGDPAALAEALAALLRDPTRAQAMGARGRERVQRRFLWSHVAERLEQALLAAIAPRRAYRVV